MGLKAVCLWTSCLILAASAGGQTQVIATIAGYGASDSSGDGGPATSAGLLPSSVVADASGNLFVAESYNCRVRKVAANGTITTYAGKGACGFSGDSGSATAASLNNPSSAVIDGSGNLFIADTYNNRIRKVSATGIISTVAGNGSSSFSGDGGPAVSASLNAPSGVAVDSAGNLFIADTNNQRIRKVSAGVISTVAGNGASDSSGDGGLATSASLSYPSGVAVDGSGNLLIADTYNNRIRMVSTASVISTVAGSGSSGFSGDGGPATSASLNYPSSVVADASGNLFIADNYNSRIREVAGGIISTVAGNGNAAFSGDLGPAVSASLDYPSGVAVVASGDFFVADYGNSRIREVSPSTPPLAATFSVDPASDVYFSLGQGDAGSQSLQIGGAAGTGWRATAATSSGGAWLTLSSTSGQAPASITALFNPGTLAPGSYQGTITVSAPGAVPPSVAIKVALQIYSSPIGAYQLTNAASGQVSGQNGAGLAQGSLFVIYGNHLGPALLQQANSFPIPFNLAGTSVQINLSGEAYNAPIIYTSYQQVAALVPSNVPPGEGTLVVTYNGSAAQPIPVVVVKSMFGVFTVPSNGAGAGVIQDINNNLLTFDHPAHSGDIVTLWGAGLGPVSGDETAGPLPGNLFSPEVFVGKQPAMVQYAGRSGCCAALDEIVYQIPPGVQGCFVPLAVRIAGAVSNFVTLPIAPAGEACFDPVGITPDIMTKLASPDGLNFGAIAVGPIADADDDNLGFFSSDFGAASVGAFAERLSSMLQVKVSEKDVRALLRAIHTRHRSELSALLSKYAPVLRARNIDMATLIKLASAASSQGVLVTFLNSAVPTQVSSQFAGALPSPGTCAVGMGSLWYSAVSNLDGGPVDAGQQLSLTGPTGTQTLGLNSDSMYEEMLGTGSAGALPDGTYVVSSNGGSGIGAFTAGIQVGPALIWSNKADVGIVDRSAPLTINWSGGPPTGYVVFGGEGELSSGDVVVFNCVEDIRNQTLTVPDFVLGAMPSASDGLLYLALHPMQNRFSATGLDVGFITDVSNESIAITFQ